MKVIRIDNYDDEGPRGTQRLVAGSGLSQKEAERIAGEKNNDPDRSDFDWFQVVPDDHGLWRFEP